MKTYVLCSIMLFWCLVTPGHANEEQQTVVFPPANGPQEDLIFIESNEKYGIDCLLYGDHFFAYDVNGQAEEIWIIRDLFFYELASGRSLGYEPPEGKEGLAMYHGFYKEVWSPNEEYLVLPLGKLLGFQIIPASDVFERLTQANNSFVRVFEASFDNAPEVFLWHSFKKWLGDDAFLFTAGDHEFNPPFVYKISCSLSYDADGNLAGYSDGTTSATYTYDDIGRKLSETVDYGPFTKSFSYTYYGNGLKHTFTAPDSTVYTYNYGTNNKLREVQIPGVGSVSIPDYTWNRPATVNYPGGTQRTYGYDALMRFQSFTVGHHDIDWLFCAIVCIFPVMRSEKSLVCEIRVISEKK